MPVLTVGSTEIPYTLRHSKKAQRLSIKVTPSSVEVVAPKEYPVDRIDKFVTSKREWIYRRVEELTESNLESKFAWPDRFVTGAKIPFYGRNMKLRIREEDINHITVSYRHGFLVTKPRKAPESDVRAAIEKWLTFRLKDDVRVLMSRYATVLNVTPGPAAVSSLKTRWGSCGKTGSIRVNWLLVMAPKPVLEYVVVHELCHLRYRNHSNEFWSLVSSCLPDYAGAKAWLERNGRLMSV